jgi:hypothetical protein
MLQSTVVRHPEWKALYDGMLPLIDGGQTMFDYETLTELARLDLRSPRGRGQFYKCRRELLKTRQLWMENIAKFGYAIIPAKDQPKAAHRRVRAAGRRVRMAKSINENVRYEELTAEARMLQAATGALLNELSKTFHSVGRKLAAAANHQSKALPVDVTKLIDSVSGQGKAS